MKKIIAFISLLFCANLSAHATEQQLSSSPEFAEVLKIYGQMTPQQRAQALESVQKIQTELAAMPPAERQKYYNDTLATMKTIDFSKVDVSKLDTSKAPQSAAQNAQMMKNQRNRKAGVTAPRPAPLSANPSKPIVD